MDGKLAIDPEDFAKYLGTMLGRSVELNALLQLTSGQQARAASWLAERGLSNEELRSRLSVPFRPTMFSEDAISRQQSVRTARSSTADPNVDSLRIGIDIQRVDELLPKLHGCDLKSSSEVTSMFSLREISYAQSRPTPLDTLCGIFAAKEALRKCDSSLLTLALNELEILPNNAGRPQFRGFEISISHSGGFAIAVAARLSVTVSSSTGRSGADPRQESQQGSSVARVAESKARLSWALPTLVALVALGCGTLILKLFGALELLH